MFRTIVALTRAMLWLVEAVLAAMVGYLGMLTVAALRAPRSTLSWKPGAGSREPEAGSQKPETGAGLRFPASDLRPLTSGLQSPTSDLPLFLILIPAHNEEKLLPDLLANLKQLDYPAARFAVHVVADNCTDRTAAWARAAGAIVHERFNQQDRGKGYALQWLLRRIWDASEAHDAIVILDADSIVSANFLSVMAARLLRGERAIQAYYAVRDPDRSWGVSLRYAALAVLHYLRPQGRMALGGSAGLKGNGMVFAADILKQHPWSASLTEDIEYHMELILAGERVTFAPDAVVWAEMPGTLAGSHTQNVRWERGRLEMVQRFVPRLLREAWQRKSFVLFDAAMEQIIPPFSILAGASVLSLAVARLLERVERPSRPSQTIVAGGLLAGQAAYLLAGLALVRAPKRIYLALIYAPAFVAWKVWLYARVLLGLDRQGWVRTQR